MLNFNNLIKNIRKDWDNRFNNEYNGFNEYSKLENSYLFHLIYYFNFVEHSTDAFNQHKYNQFIPYELLNIRNELSDLKNNNNLNFWILYLFLSNTFNDGLKWTDIENKINEFFKNYSQNIQNYLDILFVKETTGFVNTPIKNMANKLKGDFDLNDEFLNINLIILTLSITTKNSKALNIGFHNFLLSELSKFENDFSDYLSKISESETYLSNVHSTLNYLKDKENIDSFNILSFNYTNFNQTSNIKHVHSTIKDNNHPNGHPIIGIDSNNNFDKDYYMFTKTYRIMSLSDTDEYNNSILDNRINKLIFYGHSLSRADYSYFISIFDYYNIYYSDEIELTFYYSDDFKKEESDKEQVKKSYYDSVYNLINEYGTSITHGKNLLHKMLLESRLHIITMPALGTYKNNY